MSKTFNNGFICFIILLISHLASATSDDLPLKNLDFEQAKEGKPTHWHWWSRSGESASIAVTSEQAHNGEYSVRLHYNGNKDWAFVNRKDLSPDAGQGFRCSAWIKVISGSVQIRMASKTAAGKTYSDGSETLFTTHGKWRKVQVIHEIPEDCQEVDIRFVGETPTKAWIDHIQLQTYHFDDIAQKPLVQGFAQIKIKERLDRGLLAKRTDTGDVYIGWRLLENDPADIMFALYRQTGDNNPERINDDPIKKTTDFIDTRAPQNEQLTYHLTLAGKDQASTFMSSVVLNDETAQPFMRIPLQGKYEFQKVGIADLDGDGRYDYVIKQPHTNIDPFQKFWKKSEDTYKLEAYNADGEFLWRYDLGWNIEKGIWYSPYVVYDFNGDGRAEVAVKTSQGDHRDTNGRVQSGPEYLTILDGLTGQVTAQTFWLPRGPFDVTSNPYNYVSRNEIGVAYLDGKTPCIIVCRGTSGNSDVMLVSAYELQGKSLNILWQWDNINMRRKYLGQGAHWIHGADVDGDGRQEVTLGSLVLDDNGTVLWCLGMGHPDHHYVGDIDPHRPGLEIYYGMQSGQPNNGMCLVDAKTGDILWGHPEPTHHVHSRGMCSDLIADYAGAECYSADSDKNKKAALGRLRSSKGKVLSNKVLWGFGHFTVYWDEDPQREILWGNSIKDYKGKTHPINIQGKTRAVADVLGDWREEIITSFKGELRIYTTNLPAKERHVCLMQDPLYRNDVAMASMGYYQIPMLSYDLATKSVAKAKRSTRTE